MSVTLLFNRMFRFVLHSPIITGRYIEIILLWDFFVARFGLELVFPVDPSVISKWICPPIGPVLLNVDFK